MTTLAQVIGLGLASARPVTNIEGQLYYSTDVGVLERDNGDTTWTVIATGTNIASLVAGLGIDIDAYDPNNPVINVLPALTFLTEVDEALELPGSRRLVAGSNVTLDTTTPGQLVISATGGGGGGGSVDAVVAGGGIEVDNYDPANPIVSVLPSLTLLTSGDESAELPSSRQILAGTGISLNTGTPGELTVGRTFSGARVRRTTNQSIPTGLTNATPIEYDTEVFDVGGYFDIANPSRLTVPVTGYYMLQGSALFASNAGGTVRLMSIYKNGAIALGNGLVISRSAPNSDIGWSCSVIIDATAGQYFEFGVAHNVASAINILANALTPEFAITYLGS